LAGKASGLSSTWRLSDGVARRAEKGDLYGNSFVKQTVLVSGKYPSCVFNCPSFQSGVENMLLLEIPVFQYDKI
jgi:hypothetical protein